MINQNAKIQKQAAEKRRIAGLSKGLLSTLVEISQLDNKHSFEGIYEEGFCFGANACFAKDIPRRHNN